MRHIAFSVVTTLVLMVSGNIAEAGEITYAIQNYPADQQGATLSGTITTDGVIGTLSATDILSWSWTITSAGGTPSTVTSSDAGAEAISVGSIAASQLAITIAPTGNAVVLGDARNRIRFCRRPAVEARAD